MRSTTHELRAWLGLSQREFSERYQIPVSTVRNWDARGTMPDYVGRLIRWYEDTLKSLMKYMVDAGDLPFCDESKEETGELDVVVDGVPQDEYAAAPDLYSDPYAKEE